MHILTIVGARPQFVKAAVISRLLRTPAFVDKINETIIHTGQHYDTNMSKVFFQEMQIPEPDVNLGIGGNTHGAMTGEMLSALEKIIIERQPDVVLVYGDTNSTLAGALAASKVHIPVAHVEAGLRSFNKRMPEEQNRIIADHLSSWLLCPTNEAITNLSREGISNHPVAVPSSDHPQVINCGDVMFDASLYYKGLALERPEQDRVLPKLKVRDQFRLLTLHRAENTDDPARIKAIFKALSTLTDEPLIFPIHPRTQHCIKSNNIELPDHIIPISPVGYLDMLELESKSSSILTDSGGVQKEAYFFAVPCTTIRNQTEWVETRTNDWNRIVGADPDAIIKAVYRKRPAVAPIPVFGDGSAGKTILKTLLGM